jgi:hypothetical protein
MPSRLISESEFQAILTAQKEFRKTISDLQEALAKNTNELNIQFHRMAQIQAELDSIRKAWAEKGFGAYPDPRDAPTVEPSRFGPTSRNSERTEAVKDPTTRRR